MPKYMVLGQSSNTLYTTVYREVASYQLYMNNHQTTDTFNLVSDKSNQRLRGDPKQSDTANKYLCNSRQIPEG